MLVGSPRSEDSPKQVERDAEYTHHHSPICVKEPETLKDAELDFAGRIRVIIYTSQYVCNRGEKG